MPRTASRLRKARLRQEGAKVIHDPKSTARSEAAKTSKGHDERGRYGKSVPDPESDDSYDDKG